MDPKYIHSANIVDVVYEDRFDSPFDESEDWFELTKVTRDAMSWEMSGIQKLTASPEFIAMTHRGSRKYESSQKFKLDFPEQHNATTLRDVLQSRRSAPSFSNQAVNFSVFSEICSLSYGVTGHDGEQEFRAAPSAGALFPIDMYIHALNITGLEPGVYHFSPSENALSLVTQDVNEESLMKSLLQEDNNVPAFVVTLVATFWRTRFKYSHRGMRFVFLEAGHIGQNILLAATAQNLGSRAIGGFIDDELNALIPGLNGTDDAAIYSILVGHECS